MVIPRKRKRKKNEKKKKGKKRKRKTISPSWTWTAPVDFDLHCSEKIRAHCTWRQGRHRGTQTWPRKSSRVKFTHSKLWCSYEQALTELDSTCQKQQQQQRLSLPNLPVLGVTSLHRLKVALTMAAWVELAEEPAAVVWRATSGCWTVLFCISWRMGTTTICSSPVRDDGIALLSWICWEWLYEWKITRWTILVVILMQMNTICKVCLPDARAICTCSIWSPTHNWYFELS